MLQKPDFDDSDYNIPSGFATTNIKVPFQPQEIIDGYGTTGSLGLVPKGANYNHEIDFIYKWFKFFSNAIKISSQNPNGNITGEVGAICLDNINGKVYKKKNGSVSNAGWIDLEAGSVPVATVISFAGTNLKDGYLWADGVGDYDPLEYPELFAEIGYTYGNNAGRFKTPNYTKRVPIGLDPDDVDFDTLGKTGGSKTVTLSTNQIASHNHTASSAVNGDHIHNSSVSSNGNHNHPVSITASGGHNLTASTDNSGSHNHSITDPSHDHNQTTCGHDADDGYGGGMYPAAFPWDRGRRQSAYNTIAKTTGISINNGGNHAHSITVSPVQNHLHDISLSSSGNHIHDSSVEINGEHNHILTVNNTGGNESHNNMQPYIITKYIIRAY